MSLLKGPYLKHVLNLRLGFDTTTNAGLTPRGERSWATVSGGEITTSGGLKVATVLPGGGDYICRNTIALISEVDMRFLARDDEGTLFHFTHNGFCHVTKEMMAGLGSVVPEGARSLQGPLTGWNKATGGFELIVCNTSSEKHRWMNFALLVGIAELVVGDYGVEAVQYQIFRPENKFDADEPGSAIWNGPVLENIGLLRFETNAPISVGQSERWIEIKSGYFMDAYGQLIVNIQGGHDLLSRHASDSVLELHISAVGQNKETGMTLWLQSHGYLHIMDTVMEDLELNVQKSKEPQSKLEIPQSMQEFGGFDGWKSIKCSTQSEDYHWMNYAAILGQARFISSSSGIAAVEFQLFRCRDME